jgi:ATP adenylyltransferase
VDADILLKPENLVHALDTRVGTALDCGALQPIETDQEQVDDGGVRFLVRIVSSLRRKEAVGQRRWSPQSGRNRNANPFLPPEPELTVAEVSRTHVAVLNKFNVLDRHLLVVTRDYARQEALLNRDDFRALFTCMAGLDGLGFYNGGVTAGASQPHKHLQLVPLPLAAGGPAVPMEPLLAGRGPDCPGLQFAHGFRRLETPIRRRPLEAAEEALGLYLGLLSDLGIRGEMRDGVRHQSAPYNLLIARDWMLAVPRSKERFAAVPVNALGFAGSLFVKDREQLERIRAQGPMEVLAAVAGRPRAGSIRP